jgi:O-antigen/teichoic acid export membrane protein
MTRSKKFARNSVFAVIALIVSTLTTFFIRVYFIRTLGIELLGLNTVLTTILSILSVVDLGFGNAVIFALYKPIAEKNEQKIALLIKFYRKVYFILAVLIFVLGLLALPVIPFVISGYSFGEIVWPFLILLTGTFVYYILSFNQLLLMADQRNFVVSIAGFLAKLVCFGVQLAILLLAPSFLLYVAVSSITTVLVNGFLYFYTRKAYPFIARKTNEKLGKDDYNLIKQKIKALVWHSIGSGIVMHVDNIIISIFLGALIVGYYSNYWLIVLVIASLNIAISTAILPAYGNIIATEKKEKIVSTYYSFRLFMLILFAVLFVGFFVLSGQFITLWLGEDKVLSTAVVLAIGLNFFIDGHSLALGWLRYSAGVFEPDKYLRLIMSLLNIILSITFVQFWGLFGVLIATTICYILLCVFFVPHVVYKYVLQTRISGHLLRVALDYAIVGAAAVSCFYLNAFISTGNAFLDLILGGVLCGLVPVCLILVAYFKMPEFKSTLQIFKNIVKKGSKQPHAEVPQSSQENASGVQG